MSETRRNIFLDYLKLICAIEVVFLHTVNNAGLNSSDSLFQFSRIIKIIVDSLPPVEIFFVVGAYLFFRKTPNGGIRDVRHRSIVSYSKRLIVLYLSWAVFYIPAITREWSGRSVMYNAASLVKQLFFCGYSMHTWYIPVTIVGTVLIWMLLKYTSEKIAWICSIVIFVLGLSGSSYTFFLDNSLMELYVTIFGSVALLRAPIYIMLGYTLTKVDLAKYKMKYIFLIWVFASALQQIELKAITMFSLGNGNEDILILKPIIAFGVVCFVLVAWESVNVYTSQYKWSMGKYGEVNVVIYFSHVLFIKILQKTTGDSMNPFLMFVLTVFGTVVLGMVLCRIKDKPIARWLV